MQFKRLPLGIYQANCYIVYDEGTRESAIIDPGGDFNTIKEYVENNALKIKYIILTHGHGDHIGALPELREYTDAPICINNADTDMLISGGKNLSTLICNCLIEMKPDHLLEDGEILELGETKLEIIHTPGHTKGSISIKCESYLFSGDTLFARSIGRTDLPGGSFEEIISSIKDKLLVLADDTEVYPGHGSSTTIKIEKLFNPFVK